MNVILLALSLLFSSLSLADTETAIHSALTSNSIRPIPSELVKDIEYLKKRNPTSYSRPTSCPLQISKHLNILTKLESIKLLFENTCFSDFEDRFNAILEGARELEDSLNKSVSTATNGETTAAISSLSDLEKSEKVATIVGGLNDIYSKHKCSLNDAKFLVKAADIISDVSSFGTLTPGNKGTLIQAGGAGTSALLLFLNELLKRGFKFQDKNYRRSFIKLNCAFYNVRNDMESKGLFTIKTKDHEKQFKLYKDVITRLKALQKNNNDYVTNALKVIKNERLSYKTKELHQELSLLSNLDQAEKILTKEMVETASNPFERQKLELIFALSKITTKIETDYKLYMSKHSLTLSSMDKMFQKDLSHFDEHKNPEDYTSLLNLGLKEIKSTVGARLNFNINRVKQTVTNVIDKELKAWDLKFKTEKMKKELHESLIKTNKILKGYFTQLTPIKEKLKNVLSIKDFNSRDDGRGAIVDILDEFNIILSKIYGRVGHSFMSFTLNTGHKNLKSFNKKFDKFSYNHLRNGKIKNIFEISNSQRVSACQDARPFRRIYHFGNSLIEQGYDFIETNADLFHSDNFSLYTRRPEHKRFLGFMTKWSRLRRHYQSGYYANRLIHHKPVHHLSDKVLSYRSLGQLMLKAHAAKKKAEVLQTLIEQYDCLNITNDSE